MLGPLKRGDGVTSSRILRLNRPLLVTGDAPHEGHDDLVVDPLLVLATVIGLRVEDLSESGGPCPGVNAIELGTRAACCSRKKTVEAS